ncbi:MAG: cell division protein FtsL [Sterolibacterium sp.]|nr:cell division protein FtsL [Sterolibacterium sp.]
MLRLNLFLLLIVVLSALGTVSSNHQARKLVTEIEREQAHMRDLDVEWGQLQLEQSTWASHARIESIARNKLQMRLPVPGQTMTIEAVGVRPTDEPQGGAP